jgi:hypothetical protein
MSKIDDLDSRTVAGEGARATLVEMAQIWMRLAGTEEGRQVAQQQQQTQPKNDDKKE